MGIITYLFHRENGLSPQLFNMFFLDMGENIHFHYRDLRIEMSVGEFEELAALFDRYKEKVLNEITTGYKDGVLANTNEADTLKTFWDKEKKLTFPVKYNERQLSIEETKDGYHIHIRNYKILLHKESFTHLAKAMAKILPLLEKESLVRDPLQLLKDNELHPKFIHGERDQSKEHLTLEIPNTYRKKASQVLRAIGYTITSSGTGKQIFDKPDSCVTIIQPGKSGQLKVTNPDGIDSKTLPLVPFLLQHGHTIKPFQLNELKLKVLSLFKQAQLKQLPAFSKDDIYVNRKSLTPTIDLFSESEIKDPTAEYARLNSILSQNKLFFIKPKKIFFDGARQEEIRSAFMDYVEKKLIPHPCVNSIYTLGSTRLQAGQYQVPFIHFDWAKINSDFDIFIEIDPDFEDTIPKEWDRKFTYQKNGSEYYHFGDVGKGMDSTISKRFPEITFYEFLVEGYIFLPSSGNIDKKNSWFESTKKQCIYNKEKIVDWMNNHYPYETSRSERFKAASFNQVYHIFTQSDEYALKIYDHRYLSKKKQDKVAYEITLLGALTKSNLNISLPLQNKIGDYISHRNKDQAVLFTYIQGTSPVIPEPEQIRMAGRLLAQLHKTTKKIATGFEDQYENKTSLFYWLKAWEEYSTQGRTDNSQPIDVQRFIKKLKVFNTVKVHCHGDLSPINYIFRDDSCWLIDFQSAGYGPALIDLANGMVEFAQQGLNFRLNNMSAFLEGYIEIRKLNKTEQAFLRDLLLIHILTRQSKLLRLHYGGFGYDLKKERLEGLRKGFEDIIASDSAF
jgi:Ser/Thr protein kinase RdoA (MazF antagonist)